MLTSTGNHLLPVNASPARLSRLHGNQGWRWPWWGCEGGWIRRGCGSEGGAAGLGSGVVVVRVGLSLRLPLFLWREGRREGGEDARNGICRSLLEQKDIAGDNIEVSRANLLTVLRRFSKVANCPLKCTNVAYFTIK